MRDLLFFTTENGVADLILKEIPYKQTAYIRVLDAAEENLQPLLQECASFCRMAGADHIYASGHPGLERWPLYTSVLTMRGTAWVDREKLRSVFPVSEQTVSRWRQLMNERIRNVDNAATLEKKDEQEILHSSGACFVHRSGELLGGGWLCDGELKLLAACKQGMGERVCHTLFSMYPEESVRLEVASTNRKALRLYEKLGFFRTAELRRWHRVL